jgi:hypothetical protein
MVNVEYDIEIDKNRTMKTTGFAGRKKDIAPLLDPEIDDFWMTSFEKNVTYVKFKFKQPMLIS